MEKIVLIIFLTKYLKEYMNRHNNELFEYNEILFVSKKRKRSDSCIKCFFYIHNINCGGINPFIYNCENIRNSEYFIFKKIK